jgi:nucleoside-diphosphate-sugar epimerase
VKVLLTGPDGFIGAAFARATLRAGHEVAGLFLPGRLPPPGTEAIVRLDGSLALPPWKAIDRFAPDACVHTAWVTAPSEYLNSPANDLFLSWSRDFLAQLTRLGVKHLVGLGTCIEYQAGPEPMSETQTPVAPQSRYAQGKDALRRFGEDLARDQGVTFAWTRIFYPYGPGEHPERLCSSLIRRLARGQTVALRTPDSRKDYLYIEDVARAILRILESGWSGAINVGTGTGVTVAELAATIGRLLGRGSGWERAEPAAIDPYPCVVADATRLKSLGWQPQVALGPGLRQLIETLSL